MARSVPEEIQLALPYARVAARVWPALTGAGERVLALHGWLDNSRSFDFLIPHLPDHLHFVAVDLPGHGLSDHRPAGAPGYLLDYVPVVCEILDALGWETCTLLGHSMGAAISTLVAGTVPERFSRVILIEGIGPASEEEERAPAKLREFIEGDRALRGRPASAVYPALEPAVRARKLAGGLSDATARVLVERNIMERPEGGYVWRSDPRLKLPSPLHLTEDQVLAFLRAIAAPVLLVVADDSQFQQYAGLFSKRSAVLRDLTMRILSGGHHLHMERPVEVAAVINEWLAVPRP